MLLQFVRPCFVDRPGRPACFFKGNLKISKSRTEGRFKEVLEGIEGGETDVRI